MSAEFSQLSLRLILASLLGGAAGAGVINGIWINSGPQIAIAILVLTMALYIIITIEDQLVKKYNAK